jgi:hypothetical protein
MLQDPLEGPSVDQLVASRVRRAERQRDNLAVIELWPQLIDRALHLGLWEEIITRRAPTRK